MKIVSFGGSSNEGCLELVLTSISQGCSAVELVVILIVSVDFDTSLA